MTRLATAKSHPTQVRVSYDQFLIQNRGGGRLEWVEGEVVPMPPIGEGHTEPVHLLIAILKVYVQHHNLGALRSDPFQMKTGPDLPGRQPDLLFVAKRNLHRLHPLYLEGPADLAIEIVSSSSRTIDRVDKFREYEMGGVAEYWIIDPTDKSAEFYRLGRDRKYKWISADEGIFRSKSVRGFWLRIDWLWGEPDLLRLFQELGVI